MEALIGKIVDRIRSGHFQSESAVREAIVLPILQALDWDIFDPDTVIREFSLGGRRVDYALSALPPRKHIFIEVKAVGQGVGADRQLFEYAFHEGIPFAILTDGREWNFFLPAEQGSYDDRRVQKLALLERKPDDACKILKRYLQFEKVRSDEALKNARADYQNISRQKIAAAAIPTAWQELLAETDTLLIDLIAEKAQSMSGYRPAPEDVEDFLASLARQSVQRASERSPLTAPPSAKVRRPERYVLQESTPVSQSRIVYQVFGERREARSAIEALIDILKALSSRKPDFIDTLAGAVRGRTRNHIARNREDVYPNSPDLVEYTIQVVPGWWLGTNIANREKMRIVRAACDVAGVKLGREIVIELPNAS